MSVSVRLAKFGKRHAPTYRVVVSTTRYKRNGKFLDILGHYNPSDPTQDFTMDMDKYEDWKKKGAITTKAVEDLIAGTYEYVKYDPKSTGAEEDGEGTNENEETADEDANDEVAESNDSEETDKKASEEDEKPA